MKRSLNKYPILTVAMVDFLLKGIVSLSDVEVELADQPILLNDVRTLYLERIAFREASRA